MQKSLRCFLVALGLVAAAAGCGGAQTTVETAASVPSAPPPPPVRALEKLVPENAEAVVRLDLVRLRATGNYALAEAGLRALAGGGVAITSEILEVMGRVDEVWVAWVPHSNEYQPVPCIIARGRFQSGDERVAFEDERASATTRGGFDATIDAEAGGGAVLIGDHTLVIGLLDHVDVILEDQTTGDGAGPTDPKLRAAMTSVGFAQATLAGAVRASERLLDRLGVPAMFQSSFEWGAMAATLGDTATTVANLHTTSPMVAATLVTLANGQLDTLRTDPGVVALGLAPAFTAMNVTGNGQDVSVRLELDAAELAAMARSLGAAFGVTLAP